MPSISANVTAQHQPDIYIYIVIIIQQISQKHKRTASKSPYLIADDKRSAVVIGVSSLIFVNFYSRFENFNFVIVLPHATAIFTKTKKEIVLRKNV